MVHVVWALHTTDELPLNFFPAPQVVWDLHVVERCDDESWYWPAVQPALQFLAAVLVSALIFFPCPHSGCAVHEVNRCDPEV